MNITGIKNGGNTYPILPKPTQTTKSEKISSEQTSKTDIVNVSQTDGAAYYDMLRQRFDCVKNGGVSIAGAYLDKCAKDPELARRLESNLEAYNDCVQQGYQNALLSAQANGGKLLSYSETWSIDGEGGITMISQGTTEYHTGVQSWEEIRKNTLEQMEKARKEKEQKETISDTEKESEETSESSKTTVAVNEGKRARQIAAAKCQNDVRQVIALLQQDMAECKAGLEKGWCDESEIAKVQTLLNSAQAKLSQVPKETEEKLGISEFDLAGLM